MNNQKVHSLGHAVLVLLYITLVAFVMTSAEHWFPKEDGFLTPVAVLMLFVVSAAVTGTLVLGRPILMYWDGRRKEALQFFGYTIGWLFALTIIVFVVLGATK
ncbi:MAG: hypothetical protein KW802_02650 [Candidatus Doudnabacteria bacterium]|nr:hypothetical protein [Candidatus Doudnabacteria bacterium]